MGLLKPATGAAFVKSGFLGFNATGKTMTMALLAIVIREHFKLDGPVAMIDSETGSDYIRGLIRDRTGQDLLVTKTRSFVDLIEATKECIEVGVSVYLAESQTHFWRELCDGHLATVNARIRDQNERNERSGRNYTPRALRTKLEFQDRAVVSPIWEQWTNLFLTAPLHILVGGRAGFEWEMQENDEGKTELNKVGVKMKGDAEFGFEPSLILEMQRAQDPDGQGGFKLVRRGVCRKDRFGVIDGDALSIPDCDFNKPEEIDKAIESVRQFFMPYLSRLTPGTHTPLDTRVKSTTPGTDGDEAWAGERKLRVILCEEIQGELVNAFPGQAAADKKAKADLLFKTFNTRSWTAVETMHSDRLRLGLREIRQALNPPVVAKTEDGAAVVDGAVTLECPCPDAGSGKHFALCKFAGQKSAPNGANETGDPEMGGHAA